MIEIALIVLGALLLLALPGAALLALLPGRERAGLLPAVFVVGAAALVVGLHATALVTGVRTGFPFVIAASVGVLVIRRHERWWRVPVRSARFALLALVAGTIPFGFAIAPEVRAGGARVVQPTHNNDAFAYVTLADWLERHGALDQPEFGRDAPAFGYTRAHVRGGNRVGEELVQAAVSIVLARSPGTTWYSVMAMWVLLLPGAFAAGAGLFGIPRVVGLLGGVMVGLSSLVLKQVFSQNSASLLGIVLAVPMLACLAITISRRRGSTVPLWFTALLLSGLVGSYTEYVPLLAPGLAAFVLIEARRQWRGVLRRTFTVIAIAVLSAPLIWYNASRSLLGNADYTAPGSVSAYLDVPFAVRAARFLGTVQITDSSVPRKTTFLLGIAFAALVLAAILVGIRRLFVATVILGSASAVIYLSTAHRFPYGQQRAVEILQPIWLLIAVMGGTAVVQALSRPARWRALRAVVILVLLGVGGLYVHANVRTVRPIALGDLALARNVDRSFNEAAAWLERVGGDGGEDAMVIDADYFQQLWIVYAVHDRPLTSFPFVYPDYHDVPRYQLFDGRLRRYALVGRSVWVDADPGVEIGGNDRYRFLDLSKGEALIVAPSYAFHGVERSAPDDVRAWMTDDGELVVLHTPGISALQVRGIAMRDVAPLSVEIGQLEGEDVVQHTFGVEETAVTVPLPRDPTVHLVLANARKAQPPSDGTDGRDLSLYLTDVTR